MLKKLLICGLFILSLTVVAGEITNKKLLKKTRIEKGKSVGHTVFIRNGLDTKIVIGQYQIVLTRIDDRMNRIHLRSTPRNRSLSVEAFDRSGKKMKVKQVGENLSTNLTSKHKYMYKSLPEYIVIR